MFFFSDLVFGMIGWTLVRGDESSMWGQELISELISWLINELIKELIRSLRNFGKYSGGCRSHDA